MKDTTQKRLLKAATEAFARSGYTGASVREITRNAGANIAAVSYHFGDKVGLYKAVVRQALEKAAPDDLHLSDQRVPVERRLRAFLEHLFDGMNSNHRSLQHIVLREQVNPSGVLGPVLGELVKPRHLEATTFVAAAIGVPSESPVAHRTVKTLVDGVRGYIRDRELLVALAPEVFDGPDWRQHALDSLVQQGLDLIAAAKTRAAAARKV